MGLEHLPEEPGEFQLERTLLLMIKMIRRCGRLALVMVVVGLIARLVLIAVAPIAAVTAAIVQSRDDHGGRENVGILGVADHVGEAGSSADAVVQQVEAGERDVVSVRARRRHYDIIFF
jgi:hypothetical protein